MNSREQQSERSLLAAGRALLSHSATQAGRHCDRTRDPVSSTYAPAAPALATGALPLAPPSLSALVGPGGGGGAQLPRACGGAIGCRPPSSGFVFVNGTGYRGSRACTNIRPNTIDEVLILDTLISERDGTVSLLPTGTLFRWL